MTLSAAPGPGRTGAFEIVERHGTWLEVSYEGRPLFRYVYGPSVDPKECPKPHFHPLWTLGGNVVTGYRPHDHRWHTGLAMAFADVSGQNFWGGPTYVRGAGYKMLENVGRQEHRAWTHAGPSTAGDGAQRAGTLRLDEELAWITADEQTWFTERRSLCVAEVRPDEGYWVLDVSIGLTNSSGRPLEIGSPTTNGREMAGYGSLFWRGPRSFTGGTALAAGGLEGAEQIMSRRSPWLAFVGKHDETDSASTLIFVDHEANPRHPTQWFVRSTPFACASFAFIFDQVFSVPAGGRLTLSYRVIVADGAWDRQRIERAAAPGVL